MPVQENDIKNDIDSLGDAPQDREVQREGPHRPPERMEPTVFEIEKPKLEDEKPVRKSPVEETEEETDETTPTRQSSDELREALAELTTNVTTLAKATPKTPPKVMTQEEQEKFWAVYKPDPKDLRTLFKGIADDATPEQLSDHAQAFKRLQDGLTKQAFTAAYNVMREEFAKRDAQLEQLSSWRSQAEARQVRADFNSRYDVFSDSKYDRILKAVAQELESGGANFKSNEEYFDALAKNAAEYISQIDSGFDLGEPNKTKSTGKMPKLPRSGGGGGTGNAGNGGKKSTGPIRTADRNDIDSLT